MPRRHSLITILPLFLILLAAGSLRLIDLAGTPPGMPFDEIVQAEASLNTPASWLTGAHHPLFTAMQSESLSLIGHNLLGVRLPAVLCGLLTLVFTYLWARRVYGRGVALMASAFVGVSFWPLFLSRIGLDAALPPMLAALASWLAARSLRGRPSPSRIAGLSAALLVALAAFLPLVPALASPPQSLLDAAGRAILMWTQRGDPLFHTNVGERPVFNLGLAVVFVAGLIAAPPAAPSHADSGPAARGLPLMWLVAGWVAAALVSPDRGFVAGSAALPATYITLALGFNLIGRLMAERWNLARVVKWQSTVMAGVVALMALEGAWSYFLAGPNDPKARQDAYTDFFRIAGRLEREQTGQGVAIATVEPGRIPPVLFEFLPHGGADIRWFDPQAALVFPAGDCPSQIFLTSSANLNNRFRTLALDALPAPEVVRYDNGDTAYSITLAPPGGAICARSLPPTGQDAWVSDALSFPPDDPGGVRMAIMLPAQFGSAIQLVGYKAPIARQAGKTLPLTLCWQVTGEVQPPDHLSIFAHLLTADGQLAAQRDVLAFPASGWRLGDGFIQLQDISLEGVAPGKYHLQIGVYDLDSGARFPVMSGGKVMGDRLLLRPVSVTP